jgi:hypothetical protein
VALPITEEERGFVRSIKTASKISSILQDGSINIEPKITSKIPIVVDFAPTCIREYTSGIRIRPIALITKERVPKVINPKPKNSNI